MTMDPKSAGTVRVNLSPTPGFCIKSKALQAAVCKVSGQSQTSTKLDADGSQLDASLVSVPGTLTIPRGMKVFINITWDDNVPPPPESNEEAMQKAMRGEEDVSEINEESWFVPVVVSEPLSASDKAGNPSIIFDCVYNASLKPRCLRDHAFRAFLVELGLQRIEAQHSLLLSRQLGTPNITSKGKLQPRSALVPLVLYPEAHPIRTNAKGKRLIEEVDSLPQAHKDGQNPPQDGPASAPLPKSILKNSTPVQEPKRQEKQQTNTESLVKNERPRFEWTKDGDQIKITVHVPRLTYEHIQVATLDVEARRIILEIPPLYSLDVNVALSDAELVSIFGGTSSEGSAMMLKRQRDFDVEGAKAEWRVADGVVDIHV